MSSLRRPSRFILPAGRARRARFGVLVALGLAAAALLLARPVAASPWTLSVGEVVVGASLDHQYADSEFFEQGGSRRFPLRGRYQSTNYRMAARLGLTQHDELELSVPWRQVTYRSDEVILVPYDEAAGIDPFDYYQGSVIDLTRDRTGVGDLELAARHAFVKRSLALALELRLKSPTGYDGPSGTFGDEPRTEEAFLADPGRYVSPENVEDDVTLGDGQLDASASLLFGYGFSSGTFVRADAGYNLRLGGGGDQALGALKVGQAVTRKLLLYVESRGVLTLQRGRVIGLSVAAEDPSLPAEDYAGLDNLVLRRLRLERDALDVGAGLLFRLRPEVELSAGYMLTVWGRNTAVIQTVYSGLFVRTRLLD